jgi:Pyruvate/2-oxoacid:ferredoxin oxidoreductase delta subunit
MVPSERTITLATGHGKKAARCIDAWLQDSDYVKPPPKRLNDYTELALWFNTDAQASSQPVVSPEMRISDFKEIVGGLNEEQALYESSRCYSCGNCFECDGCYGACPEQAVIKLGKGNYYRFDYDKCTGCRACYDQCPCHAIVMVGEDEIAAGQEEAK